MTATPKTFWQSVFVGINSVLNTSFDEVIGNKSDTHDGNSIYSLINEINEHLHTPSRVYPTLANGVAVLGGAAWTLGNFVEIVPVNTITDDFDIHFISIEALSANDVYELCLYYGPTDIFCGSVRFTRSAIQSATLNVPVLTSTALHKVIPANSRIRAKVATAGGGDTATITLFYHTY